MQYSDAVKNRLKRIEGQARGRDTNDGRRKGV